jgi:hypothetical protein
MNGCPLLSLSETLTRTLDGSDARRLKALEDENAKLKKLLAEAI